MKTKQKISIEKIITIYKKQTGYDYETGTTKEYPNYNKNKSYLNNWYKEFE